MKRFGKPIRTTLLLSTITFLSSSLALAQTQTKALSKRPSQDLIDIRLVKVKNKNKNTTVAANSTSTTSNPSASSIKNNSLSLATTTSSSSANTAAKTEGTSVAKQAVSKDDSFVKFNVSVGALHSLGAEAPKTGKRASSILYDVWPAVTIGPVKTLAILEYNQDLNDSKASDWIDPQLVWTGTKPYAAGEYLNLSPAAFVILPASKGSRETNELKYSAGFNTTFALNTKNIGWDNVSLNYQPGYLKNENAFTTSTSGGPLTSYRIRQRVNFGYKLSDSFMFKSRFQFDSNFSYENVVRNTFFHFAQVDYSMPAFLGTYSVYLGHSNGGPALQGENYENNVKFYDGESSSFYLGLWADF